MNDEHFEYFLEKMGPTIEKTAVPPSRIARYRGRLPDQLLEYWQSHGWAGYADGSFWTVDPDEYEPALEAWLGDTPFMQQDAYHIIARSAFGKLYIWGERTGHALTLSAPGSFCLPRKSPVPDKLKSDFAVKAFFGSLTRAEVDFDNLFGPAMVGLGRLKHDEMYGFVPALALGGPATLAHLQKVKAVEHLVMLAQLSELRVLNAPAA